MPTYDYECKLHGEFEVDRSIKDGPLEICPICEKEKVKLPEPPKRLISKTSFVLQSGGVGWSRNNYSK